MSTESPISGKVARVVNDREIVINRGTNDGVQRGMVFAVIDTSLESLTDPDTGESLGGAERQKVLVRVTEVHEKFAVARTFKYTLKGGPGLTGVAGLFEPTRRVYDTLAIRDRSVRELDEEDSFVKTGDPVREVEYSE